MRIARVIVTIVLMMLSRLSMASFIVEDFSLEIASAESGKCKVLLDFHDVNTTLPKVDVVLMLRSRVLHRFPAVYITSGGDRYGSLSLINTTDLALTLSSVSVPLRIGMSDKGLIASCILKSPLHFNPSHSVTMKYTEGDVRILAAKIRKGAGDFIATAHLRDSRGSVFKLGLTHPLTPVKCSGDKVLNLSYKEVQPIDLICR